MGKKYDLKEVERQSSPNGDIRYGVFIKKILYFGDILLLKV